MFSVFMQLHVGDTESHCHHPASMKPYLPVLRAVWPCMLCTCGYWKCTCFMTEEPCEGWCPAAPQEEVVRLKELVRELRMKCREEVLPTDWSRRPLFRWAIPTRRCATWRVDLQCVAMHALHCPILPFPTSLPGNYCVQLLSAQCYEYLCWSSLFLSRYVQQHLFCIHAPVTVCASPAAICNEPAPTKFGAAVLLRPFWLYFF